jgi:hypothetical protein
MQVNKEDTVSLRDVTPEAAKAGEFKNQGAKGA